MRLLFIAGIHHSTLSLWLQGKIKGHYVKIEETIEEWLQNVLANKPRFSKNSGSKFLQIKNSPVNSEKLLAAGTGGLSRQHHPGQDRFGDGRQEV